MHIKLLRTAFSLCCYKHTLFRRFPHSIYRRQKQILQDFARREGYRNTRFFVDDGVSVTTFPREGFKQMQKMVEDGLIGTIIVKDYCAIIGLNQKDLENQGILA